MTRKRSAIVGFPLERRMAMLVTTERLVVWRASPWALRPATLLGEVPRSRIDSAALPYIGGGWRVIEVRLIDGMRIRYLIDNRNAEGFVRALSQHPK